MSQTSNKLRIAALNGSLRKNSMNQGLIKEAEQILSNQAFVNQLNIGKLPFYNADLETDPPKEVNDFITALREADGILLAVPEYTLSFTGVLKNALDWAATTPLGKPMANKPVAIMGASPMPFGTSQAQSHLRQVLFGMQVDLVQRPIVMIPLANEKFDNQGNLLHKATHELIEKLMIAFSKKINERKL